MCDSSKEVYRIRIGRGTEGLEVDKKSGKEKIKQLKKIDSS